MRHLLRLPRIQALVCFVGLAEAVVYGFTFPYFTLLLEAKGLSPTLIGLNAMVGTLGVLVVGPIVPKLIVRFGYRDFSICAFGIAALCFIGAAIDGSVAMLFIYRAILGVALASLWISTEAWLNHVVEDDHRGLMNGFFQTCYSFGFFLGPNLVYVTGTAGVVPPAAIALIAVAGIIAMAGFAPRARCDFEGEASRVDWRVAWRARGLLLIAAMTGLAETALYTLLPVFGMDIGLRPNVALMVLIVYTFGEAVLSMPLGWVADRVDRRKLLAWCALAAAAMVAGLSAVGVLPLLGWVCAFIAGATVVGLYNIALVIVGETYSGSDLPVVSTAFSMSYALGCAGGATLGGAAMDVFGPYGLPGSVCVVLIVFAIGSALAFRRRSPPKDARGMRPSYRSIPAE
jgi:MFS family permease